MAVESRVYDVQTWLVDSTGVEDSSKLQGRDKSGSIAENKDNSFPFLIFMGTLASPGKICIAADKQIICSSEVSLVEAALALLAT